MPKIRTRIAPSPTGQDLHIGNAYTALINFVFSQKYKGQFIVRIEDTDRTRLVEGSEKRILKSLRWLRLIPDESPEKGGQFAPYRQSERLTIYKNYAEQLVKDGHAYYCFCTPERLLAMRKDQEAKHLAPMYDGKCKAISLQQSEIRLRNGESHVIRLNVPDDGITKFKDLIRGEISFENKLLDDQVLLKSDGFPTYHLGVVVDDHLMEISHIIRGEEWISSTPKHILLYQFFGWEPPAFAHMPLLRNPDKSKLSKRKNPVWVDDYKNRGFFPEALRNYLASLAWSYPDGRDIFSLEEMTKVFRLEDIQTTAPIFDLEKLRWFNGEYMRRLSDKELINALLIFFKHESWISDKDRGLLLKISPLVKGRMKVFEEFRSLAGFFFEEPAAYERNLNKGYLEIILQSLNKLSLAEWNHDSMETNIRVTAQANKLKAKDLFMELRLVITGKTVGPPLLESLGIIGRKKVIDKITRLLRIESIPVDQTVTKTNF